MPCWEVQGDLHWFHYTSVENARAIAVERLYLVSERGHQLHGPGMFVTTRKPDELTEAELLTELFAAQRMPEDVAAVLILRRDETLLSTRKVGHSHYLHAAQPGDVIELAPLWRGYGIRDSAGGWLFSTGVMVIKAG